MKTKSKFRISTFRIVRENVVRSLLLGAALVSVVVSALIFWSLISETWTFIVNVDWSKTWGATGWFPRRGVYDIPTIVLPTLIVTVTAMLVAGPLGLGAGIYLSEYASDTTRFWVKPILEILAGIPSVVLGFFALTWIAPNLIAHIDQNLFLVLCLVIFSIYTVIALHVAVSKHAKHRENHATRWDMIALFASSTVLFGVFMLCALWAFDVWKDFTPVTAGSLATAGVGVGILTIPLVASISEDAMAAVPASLREASAGLGARRMTTATNVVIPAAFSGIIAAFIVATSRAIGETMVVFLAGGAADASKFTNSPFDGGLTMTAAMASLASGTDNVVGEGLTFQSLYFVGFLLFIITLSLNLIAFRFARRLRAAH